MIQKAIQTIKNFRIKIPFFSYERTETEEFEMPDRIEISFTNEALEKGVLDDFNKQIKRYKNGIVVETRKYSIHLALAMKKVHNLPILDLTKQKDDDYEFEEVTALHGEIRRTVRV